MLSVITDLWSLQDRLTFKIICLSLAFLDSQCFNNDKTVGTCMFDL